MTTKSGKSPLSHELTEIEEVERLLKDKSCTAITLSNETRKERKDVFQYLEACQIFHFASHGIEDIFDPLHSALKRGEMLPRVRSCFSSSPSLPFPSR